MASTHDTAPARSEAGRVSARPILEPLPDSWPACSLTSEFAVGRKREHPGAESGEQPDPFEDAVLGERVEEECKGGEEVRVRVEPDQQV